MITLTFAPRLPENQERPANRRGGALLELAIVIPFLLMLVVGTVDFGRIFYRGMAVAQAARAAAEFGIVPGNSADFTGMKTNGKAAVASDLTLVDADFTPAPSRSCECATEAGVFSATSPANTCTGTPCAAGGHLVVTVSVTVTKTFTTLINYPRIPHIVQITRTTKLRAK